MKQQLLPALEALQKGLEGYIKDLEARATQMAESQRLAAEHLKPFEEFMQQSAENARRVLAGEPVETIQADLLSKIRPNDEK